MDFGEVGKEMNPKFHHYFMDVARRTARLSNARRLKVGSVAVRDRRIIACGYNGTPPGADNNCEIELSDGSLKTKPDVSHSEVNLIEFAKEHNICLLGCDLYITHRPCKNCATRIKNAGFFRTFHDIDYGDTAGFDYLNDNEVQAMKFEEFLKSEYV